MLKYQNFTERSRKSRLMKNKREKLQQLLDSRGINASIIYSRKPYHVGWMVLAHAADLGQRIGNCFADAAELIEKGVLDFLKDKK
jgi:hypothetical protein